MKLENLNDAYKIKKDDYSQLEEMCKKRCEGTNIKWQYVRDKVLDYAGMKYNENHAELFESLESVTSAIADILRDLGEDVDVVNNGCFVITAKEEISC